MKQIKHIDDSALSIKRKKWGRGYQYFDENHNKITEKKILYRLKNLVIPPMWSEVNICKFDDGHIQATGRDAKGRKQYIYHSEWERKRQEEKFARMKAFAQKLPEIRKSCIQNIQNAAWSRDKVLSIIILTLDDSGIRIGNQQYAKRNETYGLTTLRRKHIQAVNGHVVFEFKGKSNKMRTVTIEDEELVKLIKKSSELPGYEIFRYKDSDGTFQNIDSDDVNEYITNKMGESYSSKDFRTWVASRLAIEFYPETYAKIKEFPRRKFSNMLIKQVAEELGNTPTICKDYYVHPKIFQAIDKKGIPLENPFSEPNNDYDLTAAENLALKIIS